MVLKKPFSTEVSQVPSSGRLTDSCLQQLRIHHRGQKWRNNVNALPKKKYWYWVERESFNSHDFSAYKWSMEHSRQTSATDVAEFRMKLVQQEYHTEKIPWQWMWND